MPTTLQEPRVATALDRMYAESREQMALLRAKRDELGRLSSASAQERADAMSDFYIPVTPEAGRLLYSSGASSLSRHYRGIRYVLWHFSHPSGVGGS